MTAENPQPAQPEEAQPAVSDLDEQVIATLPVEAEERRKMAETMQELHYQGGVAPTETE